MAINIKINLVNLAVDQRSNDNVLLLVHLGENPKLPPDVRVLASAIPLHLVGYVLRTLLHTLQVPSLGHINQIPALLQIEEGGKWILADFLDETRQFNVEDIIAAVDAAVADAAKSSTDDAGQTSEPAKQE